MNYKNATPIGDSRHAALVALVQRLCRANPHASLALLLDGQGQLYCPDGLGAASVRAAMPLLLPLRELAERAAAELGCGVFQHLLLEGNAGVIALSDIDGERTAVVAGQAKAPPGALRADAIWLAKSVRDLG